MTRRVPNDFNGDGMSDIIWRSDGGTVQIWEMNGATILNDSTLGVVPTYWNIIGTGDYNGDGTTDLLWRDASGASTQIWNMHDGTISSTRDLGFIPPNWKLLGSDDFNNDGKADLIWRNDAGATQIWNMNDGTVVSTRSLGVIPSNWNFEGSGDFNGDGKTDLLWRNSSGVAQIWNMDDGTILSTRSLGVIPWNWKLADTGDFNGDGTTDLLWRNGSGVTQIWNMNDGAIASTRSLGVIPAVWKASVGDYNGDGMADLIWRNDTGAVAMWEMNDGAITQATSLGGMTYNWQIVSTGSGATFAGTSGNDVLVGTGQADNITALDGNDTLQGLGGNDDLNGGNGFDRAVYSDATGPLSIKLAIENMQRGTVTGTRVGSDTLRNIEAVTGSAFNDVFDARGFATFVGMTGLPGVAVGQNAFEGGGGDDTVIGLVVEYGKTMQALTRVEYLTAAAAVTVDLAAYTGQGTAVGDVAKVGHDTYGTALQGVYGSAYDDTLYGSNNVRFTFEVFAGRGGNDFIDGRGGYDMVVYDDDPSTTTGVTVQLAAGTVTGDATVGTDTLRDIEAVRGTSFADLFDATGYGASGALNVSSSMGSFNDFAGAGGNDTIIGNGNTRLNFQLATAGVTVDMEVSAGTAITVAGTASGTSEGTDTFTGVNAAQGSMFNDTLLGSSYDNQFLGLGGDDFIDGRGGFDTVSYNNLTMTTDGVTVNLAAGTATGNTSIGTDTLRDIEAIQGSTYDDTYDATGYGLAGAANVSSGGSDFNQFEGLGGSDRITGNGNTQVLYTTATAGITVKFFANGSGFQNNVDTNPVGVGSDTFVRGVNSVVGGNFGDKYDASEWENAFNSFLGNGGNDTITGNGFTQILYNNATGAIDANLATGIVAGGDASVGLDTITGGVNSVLGSDFNDLIAGRSITDILDGGGGDDTIKGGGGADMLTGGAGDDNFVFVSGATAGATITDFTGNGASAGDTLEFHGFGLAADGATLTFISGTQWQVHSGLDGHNEIINITGSVHVSDYQFLA
ncbi:VCBS repeat-containing protein [Bradyrhizobium lablabi]|uniref:FG-GAP-like repeat-containing protein n=1 Tax=Bradyrhizobium lablabi TaxID=722472 RepID=UPI001BAC9FB6|nr:FG-GAP-like repeat-containing protein [Bradyrhizobium lablabi]MBR1125405.1 VCBS repeat-containing protein [Bradyrhizobium lablabi]